jgi:hypothetical protein
MKANHAQLIRFGVAVLALASFAIYLPLRNAGAQQDRQLVQNGSQPGTTNIKRIALVIGNGAYVSAPALKNPPNDARDMAATLRTLGFDVVSGINANQKDMKRLIREFGMKLKSVGGSGLFYYAGHGVQSKGRNYLIPVDADIQSEAEVEDSGVDAALVLNYMDEAQNGLNIVILDACRNNPFARSFRSASDGLAQVDAPTGTLIAYATAPGRVASDGTAGNGLYTAELLKQMKVPGLSVTDMFMRVRAEVMKQTGNKQVPWEASSLVGSFYFTGGAGDVTPATNTAKIDPVAFELSYWETIKNSTSADDFKAYLARYPQGQFVELAKNRIGTLGTSTKPVETSSPATVSGGPAELAFWDSVKNSKNAEDFRAYLKKYPQGEFVDLANIRLRSLEKPLEPVKPADDSRSWKGTFGVKSATLGFEWPGTLKVSRTAIEFHCEGNDKYCKAGDVRPFACATELPKIELEKNFIREIAIERFKYRLTFGSAADASSAFAAIKQACNPNVSSPANTSTSNGLIGTTWKGDSPGGDKHYEVQFLADGQVIWNLRWNNYGETKGFWKQEGDTITLVLDGYLKPVILTLNGGTMNGSWSGGQYKFTLTKVQ